MEKNKKQEIKEWIIVIIIGLAAVFLIRNYGFRITEVKGASMAVSYTHLDVYKRQ